MKPGADSDAVLLAHMAECLTRIASYTAGGRAGFDTSTLIQDGVIRNLQTLAESSQRLSEATKATEANLPWRELAGFRNVVVHAYLALDLALVWSIVDQDVPGLTVAVQRMATRLRGTT